MTGGINLWSSTVFDWTIFQLSTPACKLWSFFTYTSLDYSTGILCLLTGSKCFSLLTKCREKRENLKTSILFALTMLVFYSTINSHFIFAYSTIQINDIDEVLNDSDIYFTNICTFNSTWYTFYVDYWPFIDAIAYSFLPFIFLSIFSILIIIFSVKKARKCLEYEEPADSAIEIQNIENTTQNLTSVEKLTLWEAVDKQLILNFFLRNIFFLFLTSPLVILQIQVYRNINSKEISKHENYYDLLKAIAELLQYTNHSLSFFFYYFTSHTFQKYVKYYFSYIYRKLFQHY